MIVTDAADDAKRWGSLPLAKGTSAWQTYSVEFTTPEKTSAVPECATRELRHVAVSDLRIDIALDSFSVEQLDEMRASSPTGQERARTQRVLDEVTHTFADISRLTASRAPALSICRKQS